MEAATSAAIAAERSGDLERAYAEWGKADRLGSPSAAGRLGELRPKLVSKYTALARSAFRSRNLDDSIRHWDQVLGYDPGNAVARTERDQAIKIRDSFKPN